MNAFTFSFHCCCRARLSDLDNWRVNVEAASQHFDSLVGGLRSNWFHLEQRFDQISNRIEHRGRTPRAIDCSPYQQQVQQVEQHAYNLPCWTHAMSDPNLRCVTAISWIVQTLMLCIC